MGLLKNLWNRITGATAPQSAPPPADRPQRRSWRDWLPWNRRKREEPEEEPEEPVPEPQPPKPPIADSGFINEPPEPPVIDADHPSPGVQYEYPIGPIPGSTWEGPEVPTVSDATLLARYRKMLDTMVERKLIKPFANDKEAAEFLRVLGSRAWEEAHSQFGLSETVFKDVQEAVEHGATAGALQDDYNMALEKKSKDFLRLFEDWREREWPETAAQEEKPVKRNKQTRKQKKRNKRR